MRSWLPLLFSACLVLPLSFAGGQSVQIESSRPATSPDGRRIAVVDRLLKLTQGEVDRFSGGMVLRVSSEASSSVLRQRYVEGTQVRLLQSPVWLDATWCAFTYNIAKSANGIVYLNSDSGEGYQVEFVAPPRRMGATGTIEQEVTSLDVTMLGTTATRILNVPYKGGSAFPLRLRPLPRFESKPFGKEFLDHLISACEGYRLLLATNNASIIEPEQATEAFSADEKTLALLACVDHRPVLCIVPLSDGDPRVLPLDEEVSLNCIVAASDAEPQPGDVTGFSRFTTSWKDESQILVEREVFTDDDTSHRELVYTAHLNGNLVKAPRPKRPEPTPSEPEPAAVEKRAVTPADPQPATTRTRPLLKVTTRKATPQPTAVPAEDALATPEPTVAPVPTKKSSLFEAILPRSRPARSVSTPPPVSRTPSD
ncbi:MAG: hypothetical protein ACR2IE_02295 [Candidatus Sumerlaeaceae bacterium]